MNKRHLTAALLAAAAPCAAASAGIPEPDYITYGQVCIGPSAASATDDVTIIAKATVASELREVGRYKMGDSDAATDCNGDADCYILRIRLESVPTGESPSGQAVILNRGEPATVQLFLLLDEAPEQLITEFDVADSGVIRRFDLRDAVASADLNGDGHDDLSDYQVFVNAARGPKDPALGACNPADLNGDGYVDLHDFGLFQALYTGPGE